MVTKVYSHTIRRRRSKCFTALVLALELNGFAEENVHERIRVKFHDSLTQRPHKINGKK